MNLPLRLQQEIEKWAHLQGVSSEQFILQAVVEKVDALNQQSYQPTTEQPKVYYEGGVLVVDAELPSGFDINTFIDKLREERDAEMTW